MNYISPLSYVVGDDTKKLSVIVNFGPIFTVRSPSVRISNHYICVGRLEDTANEAGEASRAFPIPHRRLFGRLGVRRIFRAFCAFADRPRAQRCKSQTPRGPKRTF